MPIGYTTNTWMKYLNATGNKELVRMLLEHDPKMISQIYNFTFDDAKPIVDKSISYLNRMNFLRARTHTDLAAILNYAYKKNRVFRKQLFVALSRMMNKDENRRYWNSSIQGEFELKDYAHTLYDMFLYDPMYILTVRKGLVREILEITGNTPESLISNIKSSDKLIKVINKKLDTYQGQYYRRNETKFGTLQESLVGYMWGTEYIFAKDIDEKIEDLEELFGEADEVFQPALLYLKLTV